MLMPHNPHAKVMSNVKSHDIVIVGKGINCACNLKIDMFIMICNICLNKVRLCG